MANATLDTMLLFCSRQVKRADFVKTGTAYAGDALIMANKLIDAINYAKTKICKERYRPIYKQTLTIDSNLELDLDTLTKTITKIRKITYEDSNTEIIDYDESADNHIIFPNLPASTTVDVEYYYIITDFSNNPDSTALAVTLDFPVGMVDWKVICYYACYEYHLSRGSDRDLDRTGFYLNLWNDGFLHIPHSVKGLRTIKDRQRY